MEPDGSLPHSQVPATSPYPEPDQSSSCSSFHVLKIHFNIVLPSKPRSSRLSLSFSCSWRKSVCTTYTCHMSRPSNSSGFDHLINTWWAVKIIKLDRKIILKWVLMKSVGWAWTWLTWLGRKQVARFCERGNERCGFHIHTLIFKDQEYIKNVLYYNIVFTNKTLEPDMFRPFLVGSFSGRAHQCLSKT